MNIVLDTNVFISGIFWQGNYCSQIITAWKNKRFDLVVSIPIIDELIEVLRDFKINLHEQMIQEWKNLIIQNSIIVEPTIKLNIAQHEEDNKFIETAIEGNAEYIISQDKHLLNINNYNNIKILKPEEFLKLLDIT